MEMQNNILVDGAVLIEEGDKLIIKAWTKEPDGIWEYRKLTSEEAKNLLELLDATK